MVLVAGLVVQAQTPTTIYNPGSPSTADFPSAVQGYSIDWNSSQLAQGYNAGLATLKVYGVKRFRDPDTRRFYSERTDFLSTTVQAPAGVSFNTPIVSNQGEALSLGVPQATLTAFYQMDPGEPYLSATIYKTYIAASVDTWTPDFRKYGTAVLMVNVPEAGTWKLTVTSGLLLTKSMLLNLPAGDTAIQVTNVDAGNCRMGLTTYNTGNYYREEPVVVRAEQTGGAGVRFTTSPNDPHRFTIKHLSIGQATQNEGGSIPLVSGRDAMVRIMLQDSKGNEGTLTKYLYLSVPNGTMQAPIYNGPVYVSPNPVTTGTAQAGSTPFVIPGYLVQPGLLVNAYLSSSPFPNSGTPDRWPGLLDQKTIQAPQVFAKKSIVINTFDVRPYPGASGCPVARDPNGYWTQVARYMADLYPNLNVTIRARGKIWIADPLASRSTISLLGTIMLTMNHFAAAEGIPQGDATNFYIGMINGQFISDDVPGMTWYGYPGVALAMKDANGRTGHDLAHEMAHSMGLEHAPSPGANVYFAGLHLNRVDNNYPYSGNGMSAGYGFSALNQWFNKEIERHWDPMSYASPKSFSTAYFSDYFYQTLLTAGQQGRPGFPASALGQDPYGIPLLDTSQAQQIDAFMTSALQPGDFCVQTTAMTVGEQGQYLSTTTLNANTRNALRVSTSGAKTIGATSLARQGVVIIDPGDGGNGGGGTGGGGNATGYPNPLLGDPDDPTPPILIVKTAPTIPGQ